MVNFIATLSAIIGYNSGLFWQLFFTANAVCRYKCNRLKLLLRLSLISIVLFYVLVLFHMAWSPKFIFGFQAIICSISFSYNIYKKNWKRDYLFFWIEPFLILVFVMYSLNPTLMMVNLQKWLLIYLSLQALVALWEFLGLHIKVRDYEVVFGVTPHSPLQELFDESRLRLKSVLAKLSDSLGLRRDYLSEADHNNNGNGFKKTTEGRK